MRALFLILIVLSVSNQTIPKIKNYPSFIDPSKENVWGGDVRFSIENIEKTDKYVLYTLKSVYNHDTLGFKLSLPTRQDKSGSGEGLQIISSGKISKNFKNALASVYKIKVDKSKDFPDKIKLSFVNLDTFTKNTVGKEATDKNGFVDYKLFFEDLKESDEGEAELFLNINEQAKILELREKDLEYRKLLIGFLRQKSN